jgi:hypothetical protein
MEQGLFRGAGIVNHQHRLMLYPGMEYAPRTESIERDFLRLQPNGLNFFEPASRRMPTENTTESTD